MAYNKAKEEKKWRLWKEAEEKQLRNLGVTEDDIEQLRIHDWAIFNSDRRYYQRVQESPCSFTPSSPLMKEEVVILNLFPFFGA